MTEKKYFHTLDTFKTELSADTVEWCPVEPFKDVLACGTYKLPDKNKSETANKWRLGQIYLLRVTSGGRLEKLHQINTSGILDMKWAYVADGDNNIILLGVANSDGYLKIYELRHIGAHNGTELKLIAEERISGDDVDVMALSLDWSVGRDISMIPHAKLHIVVSDDLGRVIRFTWHDADTLIKDFAWPAHRFQAWIVTFNYSNENIFYSGGDDNIFLTFDTRVGSTPVLRNNEHTSGVTCIHNNVAKPFMLATGSYDNIVRFWDTRSLKKPTSTIDLDCEIWRLKWDPFKHDYLFAACMSGGFNVVDCSDKNLSNKSLSPSVCGHYDEHFGLSYGCDWSSLRKEDIARLKIPTGDTLVSTCSFEDCTLKLSAINFTIDEEVDD